LSVGGTLDGVPRGLEHALDSGSYVGVILDEKNVLFLSIEFGHGRRNMTAPCHEGNISRKAVASREASS
jgi:hypothetical protein